jgi:hypothetical protein
MASHAATHDTRINGSHIAISDAQPVRDAGLKTLDDHVSRLGEIDKSALCLRLLEVEPYATLVSVDHGLHRCCDIIARTDIFDLDHVGAHVSQMLGADGAR